MAVASLMRKLPMAYVCERFQRSVGIRQTVVTLISLTLLGAMPTAVLAHAGHGDEFHGGEQTTPTGNGIQVDRKTAERIGLRVDPVVQRRLAIGIKATGQIETLPNQQVEVTTPVGGTVTRLLVSPGRRVKVGQALAVMSSPELARLRTEACDRRAEAIAAVQQAQADLQLAQQTYRQQQQIVAQEITQAQTALRFAQEKYDKDQELLASGAIPRRTFLESETQLAEAKANLTKAESRLPISEAQSQLQRAQSGLQAAQAKVQLSEKTYQTRLRQLGASPNPDGTITLSAPIAGTVADREATPGESGEDAGKKIMTIVNGSRVQVSANIYEKDLTLVRVGQPVRVRVNGLPAHIFQGQVSVIGAVVDGETRVVPVKAELNNADAVLRPGMFAELDILSDRALAPVLTVPRSAIVETTDQKPIVFVQNGRDFQLTEVTLGQAAGDFVEIKDGLFAGDQVVTQRASQLYAQTLRGGSQTTEAQVESPTSTSATPQAVSILTKFDLQPFSLPWWVAVPGVGAIAASMFWLGRRSTKPKTPDIDQLDNAGLPDSGSAHPTPANQDGCSANVNPAQR